MKIKSKYLVIILIICIIFNITTVLASDNHNDADSSNPFDFNINDWIGELLGTDYKSFNDLSKDMKDCNDTFDMKNDYKYGESDNESTLIFFKDNFVINGNNHVIDCSNKTVSLNFPNPNVNVTINDLTFVNCNMSVSLDLGSKFNLNNVNFTNDNPGDNSSSFEVPQSHDLILNNCDFDSSVLAASYVNTAVYNSHFHNVDYKEASITVDRNDLFIENSTFENISTKYGAVNFKGVCLSVKNSTFGNVHSDLSGGAILGAYYMVQSNLGNESFLYRQGEDMIIDNCAFSNTSSNHDGGAVYMDFSADDEYKSGPMHISNCNFTDSVSGFGGSFVAQSGLIDISNTNFINSKANDLGGAIYTTWTNLTLNNCSLINNSAESNAGAVYFDYGNLTIGNSNFTGNNVNSNATGNESIIYANDAAAKVHDSTFKNGGVAIYGNFASGDSAIKKVNSTDKFLMNNTDYITSVENKGVHLNLVNNSSAVTKLPSKFDSREKGWTSPIKYQGDSYSCWAFATAAALESSLLKSTGKLYNLSEDNINNLQLKYYSEGDLRNNHTGFAYSGLGHSLSWYGIVTSKDDPFDERGMISSVVQTDERIHLQDAMIVFGGRNDTNQLLKSAVINNGAASAQYSINKFNYNATDYTVDDIAGNVHFVPVVGWDDNYPAENFNGTDGVKKGTIPKGNGAWLVKDSENSKLSENEGTFMGQGGYVWISYYNPSFLAPDMNAIVPQPAAVSYIFENDNDYHVNYQTDLTGLCGFDGKYTQYSNEFTSKYSENIGAVGTYFNESGIQYSFDIYVNGQKVHNQSGISDFAGFKTIVLDKYVPIKTGDDFKVVFKNNALPYQAYSRQHYMPNMSLISEDGNSWSDISLENKTVCLKVYTVG
ncbi:C1 family peptidase [Methanobrevibacter sp.]|uniref:C1 family peptidase n=1 Tax=Methanobrevibacter sp. TaxID=66852 RepID=UPI00386433FE